MKTFASLPQILTFVKIAETGSLSKAARDLCISPSAVSKSLAQLEDRIGVLLVKRTTRSLMLTERGLAFFEKASSILNDMEQALDEANQFKKRPMGTLRLTCSIAFGCAQLSSAVGQYMELYPDVNIHISLNDNIVNLSEENYDIALRITNTDEWGYATTELAPVHWVYCASPDYIDKHEPLTDPEDLKNHKCLVYPVMTANGAWTFQEQEKVRQIKIKGRLVCNSSLALLAAALEGQGIACLPTYVACKSILNGELQIVLPAFRSASVHTLYAMYFSSKYKNPLIRSFIDFLIENWGPIPPWDNELNILYPCP